MGNIHTMCSHNNNDANLELGLKGDNFQKQKHKYKKGSKRIDFYHNTPEGRAAINDLDSIFFE
jgi:hypothetical protein